MMAITILSQEACPSCDQAKSSLSRIADDYPVAVTEIPLATAEGSAIARRVGLVFAPGVLIGDELFSYGRLSEKKLRRHLDALGLARPGA
jgi:glutaredoxin